MAGDAVLVAISAVCALTDAATVDLARAQVRLADVVSLDCVAPARRDRIGDLTIASVDGARSLTRSALAALVRRRVPALTGVSLGGGANDLVHLRAPREHSRAVETQCFAAGRPINAGAAISAEDLMPAPCADDGPAPLQYDRTHGVVRASQDIAAGAQLGRILAPPSSIIDAGEDLTITIALGPVTIERAVEAVQTSRGGAVFVRDRDGHVFAAPLPERAP